MINAIITAGLYEPVIGMVYRIVVPRGDLNAGQDGTDRYKKNVINYHSLFNGLVAYFAKKMHPGRKVRYSEKIRADTATAFPGK